MEHTIKRTLGLVIDDDFYKLIQGVADERGYRVTTMLKTGLELFLDTPLKIQKKLHDEQKKTSSEQSCSVTPYFKKTCRT